MNSIFTKYVRKFILVFMDDILVYSKNIEEHVEHLKLVFGVLREQQLFAKRIKCSFAQKQLEYLGHISFYQGVASDLEKTRVILNWPRPTNVT